MIFSRNLCTSKFINWMLNVEWNNVQSCSFTRWSQAQAGPCGIKLNDSSNAKYIIQYVKTIIKHDLQNTKSGNVFVPKVVCKIFNQSKQWNHLIQLSPPWNDSLHALSHLWPGDRCLSSACPGWRTWCPCPAWGRGRGRGGPPAGAPGTRWSAARTCTRSIMAHGVRTV